MEQKQSEHHHCVLSLTRKDSHDWYIIVPSQVGTTLSSRLNAILIKSIKTLWMHKGR